METLVFLRQIVDQNDADSFANFLNVKQVAVL